MRRNKLLLAIAGVSALLWASGVLDVTSEAPAIRVQAKMPLAQQAAAMSLSTVVDEESNLNHNSPPHNYKTPVTELVTENSAAAEQGAKLQLQQLPDKSPQAVLEDFAGSLPQAIEQWTNALAADPRFQDWKDAEQTISPLGPGLHGWVVILSREQREIGYLIIHAHPSGHLHLSEYGTGPHALFSLKALRQAAEWNGLLDRAELPAEQLADQQVKLIYPSPAEAVYAIQSGNHHYIVNAKNGEWYELEPALQLGKIHRHKEPSLRHIQHVYTELSGSSLMIEHRHLPEFDAFEHTLWLDGEELMQHDFATLARLLDQGVQVVAVTYAYDEILIIWPIIGYHLWNEEIPYVIVSDEGERYIPFDPITMTFYIDSNVLSSL